MKAAFSGIMLLVGLVLALTGVATIAIELFRDGETGLAALVAGLFFVVFASVLKLTEPT